MPTSAAAVTKPRILFIAEAVTLAHVARPYVLATSLDAASYEVHFAHHPRYRQLFGDFPFTEHSIESIEPRQFLAALAAGAPLYDEQTLTAYVEADRALLREVAPDVVVGDFRLSLAVSATLAGIPYITLSNAYWSPYTRQKYPVPELPLVRVCGPVIGQALFSLVRPLAFFLHTRPLNRVRRAYGLPGLGGNLRELYTCADRTLYADIPSLFRTRQLPDSHRFIGPIVWSPADPAPVWWEALPAAKPVVYVTLGSSGNAALLPAILDVLAGMEVTVIASTAGGVAPANPHDNVYLADFLPGDAAAARASLVICNGGSPTTHQALAAGTPVLGIAGNLDQYLNMQALAAAGVGVLLRSGRLHTAELRQALGRMLTDDSYRVAAAAMAGRFRQYHAAERFQQVLVEVLAT